MNKIIYTNPSKKINTKSKNIQSLFQKITRRKKSTLSRVQFLSTLEHTLENHRLIKQIPRLKSCMNWFRMGSSLDFKTNDLKQRLIKTNRCNIGKFCENCASINANKNGFLFKQYLRGHPKLVNMNWYFMVLTIKSSLADKLVDLLSHLNHSVDKIRQSIKDSKRGKNKKTFWANIQGAILSFEITYNNLNGRHPHVNILFCSNNKLPLSKKYGTYINDELTKAWKKKTGDSYITSIQKVNPNDKIHEVIKYITKFSELSNEKLVELYNSTNRFRFIRRWDLLHKAPVSEDLDPKVDETPFVFELLNDCRYNFGNKEYNYLIPTADIALHNIEAFKLLMQENKIPITAIQDYLLTLQNSENKDKLKPFIDFLVFFLKNSSGLNKNN